MWPIFSLSSMCVSLRIQILIQSVYGRMSEPLAGGRQIVLGRFMGNWIPHIQERCCGSLVEWPFSLVCMRRSMLTALNGERQRQLDPPQGWGHVGLDRAITPSRHTNICTCFSEGLALCLFSSMVLSVSLSLCQCLHLLSVHLCFCPPLSRWLLSHSADYFIQSALLFILSADRNKDL